MKPKLGILKIGGTKLKGIIEIFKVYLTQNCKDCSFF